MAEDLISVQKEIRACIVSNKGPMTIKSLSEDYEYLVGSEIPFRQLSYTTLEEFLRSISTLRVNGSGSQATVEAATSSASKHISDLISKQKSKKVISKKFVPQPYRRFNSTSSLTHNAHGHKNMTRDRHDGKPYGRGYSSRYNNDNEESYFNQEKHCNSKSVKTFQADDYSSLEYETRKPNSRDGQYSRDYQPRNKYINDHEARVQAVNNYRGREMVKDYSRRDCNDNEESYFNKENRFTGKIVKGFQANGYSSKAYETRKPNSGDFQARQEYLNDYEARDQHFVNYHGRETIKSRRYTIGGDKFCTGNVEREDREVLWDSRERNILISINNF